MKKLLKNKKGFTLIELIVVIAILAILAAILIPSITSYIDEATRTKDAANARALYSEAALEIATASDGSWEYDTPCENEGTVDSTNLDSFSCEIDGYTYAAPNFVGVEVEAE